MIENVKVQSIELFESGAGFLLYDCQVYRCRMAKYAK